MSENLEIKEVRPVETKHDPFCDCGICAYCNGEEDALGNRRIVAATEEDICRRIVDIANERDQWKEEAGRLGRVADNWYAKAGRRKARITELERENFEQSDLIERLEAENAELKAANEWKWIEKDGLPEIGKYVQWQYTVEAQREDEGESCRFLIGKLLPNGRVTDDNHGEWTTTTFEAWRELPQPAEKEMEEENE